MANRAVKRGQSVVDPMFHIPDGSDEFIYSDKKVSIDDSLDDYQEADIFFNEDGFEDYTDTPGVPDIYDIVSQTIRTNADGSQVVDVVIEVEDLQSNKSKYEIRVTKV